MSRRVTLRTEAGRLPVPTEQAQVIYTDDETPYLRLSVSRTGLRSWDWRKANTTKPIGKFPAVTYDDARQKALALTRLTTAGQDPRAAILAPASNITVRALFDEYVARKLTDATRTRKPNESAANFRSQSRPLMERYGDLPVVDLSREIIMQVIRSNHLHGPRADWRTSAARQMITWVRAAFAWGQRNKMVPLIDRLGLPLVNPATSLIEDERDLRPAKKAGTSKGYKVDLADEEIIALMRGIEEARAAWKPGRKRRMDDAHALRNPSGLLILEFCLYVGCRKSEAIHLHRSDIVGEFAHVPDEASAVPAFVETQAIVAEHKTEATGEQRELFLGPEARRVIALAAEWRKFIRYTGPLVFPSPTGLPCTTVNHSLETARQVGGLTRRIVPHSLRSAYINYACRAGVPIEVVSRNVGHLDVRTTERYYREVHRRIQAKGNDAVSAEFTRLRKAMLLAA